MINSKENLYATLGIENTSRNVLSEADPVSVTDENSAQIRSEVSDNELSVSAFATPEEFGCPKVEAYYYDKETKKYYTDENFSTPAQDMSTYIRQAIETGRPVLLTGKYFVSEEIVSMKNIYIVGINNATIYADPFQSGPGTGGLTIFGCERGYVQGVTFESQNEYPVEVVVRDDASNWREGNGYSSNVSCLNCSVDGTMRDCVGNNINCLIGVQAQGRGNIYADNCTCNQCAFGILFSNVLKATISNCYIEMNDTITDDTYTHCIYTWVNPTCKIYISNTTCVSHGRVNMLRFRDGVYDVEIDNCAFVNDNSYATISILSDTYSNMRISNSIMKETIASSATNKPKINVNNCRIELSNYYFNVNEGTTFDNCDIEYNNSQTLSQAQALFRNCKITKPSGNLALQSIKVIGCQVYCPNGNIYISPASTVLNSLLVNGQSRIYDNSQLSMYFCCVSNGTINNNVNNVVLQ